ncbi:hypothetical protein O9K51_00718 [Purpureocillium lavendulum]|uniref:Uncharacterized protein n=1 Tax=Purpureocillium lavendulum TaxID=1247861 RepID=A0AB34G4I3_9HYPO|nr:hypothetical protein O9K51_00718 [Purpureocillium lavendulum]
MECLESMPNTSNKSDSSNRSDASPAVASAYEHESRAKVAQVPYATLVMPTFAAGVVYYACSDNIFTLLVPFSIRNPFIGS